jgi:hypothetical protein
MIKETITRGVTRQGVKIQFIEYDGFNNIKITMIGKVAGSPYNIFLLRLRHGMRRAVTATSTSRPIRMLALARSARRTRLKVIRTILGSSGSLSGRACGFEFGFGSFFDQGLEQARVMINSASPLPDHVH